MVWMKQGARWWTACLLVLGAGFSANRATAQSAEANRMAAETLFVEAKRLMEAGQYSQACPKLADSQRIDPAVGTLLNLALCYERLGKLASAWSTYREAAAAARSAGQTEREGVARQRGSALEPRLGRLTITVPPALASVEGLEVRVDGNTMPASLWGVAAPVDPGDHTVEVSAKGKKPWSTRIQVAPPSQPTVIVPNLENSPIEPKAPVAPETAVMPGSKSSQRTIALVLGGTGVAALAAGAFFGISARSTYHQADGDCSTKNVCNAAGTDLRNSAYGKATVSTIAFGVGGAALVSAVVLWLTAPKDESEGPRVGLGLGPLHVVVGGAW
jgi:serine/threonine-protein kinase